MRSIIDGEMSVLLLASAHKSLLWNARYWWNIDDEQCIKDIC